MVGPGPLIGAALPLTCESHPFGGRSVIEGGVGCTLTRTIRNDLEATYLRSERRLAVVKTSTNNGASAGGGRRWGDDWAFTTPARCCGLSYPSVSLHKCIHRLPPVLESGGGMVLEELNGVYSGATFCQWKVNRWPVVLRTRLPVIPGRWPLGTHGQ